MQTYLISSLLHLMLSMEAYFSTRFSKFNTSTFSFIIVKFTISLVDEQMTLIARKNNFTCEEHLEHEPKRGIDQLLSWRLPISRPVTNRLCKECLMYSREMYVCVL